jgi:alpha-tubulin suppressor-like RCC1 family protein
VATGSSHCGAVTEDGGVHMWGANGAGQCGLAGPASIPNPTPVALLLPGGPAHSAPVLELALGHAHSLALSKADIFEIVIS